MAARYRKAAKRHRAIAKNFDKRAIDLEAEAARSTEEPAA